MSTTNSAMNWQVSELREHPRQQDNFGDVSDRELQELADDIRANGLLVPLEILPDGTVVCGHQRLRAVQRIGWTEINVVVRNDLAEAGGDAVERRMIEDNLHRRQMKPLALARAYERLRQLRPKGRRSTAGESLQDTRDRLAAAMGDKSGRQLDRDRRLLRTPRPVQDAVDAGTLTKSAAAEILKMSEKTQLTIAKKIRAGESPAKVVARFTPQEKSNAVLAVRQYKKLLRLLQASAGDLERELTHVVGRGGLGCTPTIQLLETALKLLNNMLSEERRFLAEIMKEPDALAERIRDLQG